MPELYRYAAFISYSSKDSAFAKRLHRALESYGIPSSLGKFDLIGGKQNRIYPVFRDREELSAGQLGDQIEANLSASAALIVVCSPNSAASPWVQKEIEVFVAQGRHARIFAIIPDTAPLLDESGADATASCFPPAFRGDALAGDKLEPLAADARKSKDGFRNAWLKIVAGMIGVSPGQILDRDRRRRRGQFVRAAGASALVLVGASYAYSQRATIEPWVTSWMKYKWFAHSAAELAAAQPGAAFQDCQANSGDCPMMVVIPEGTFLMGEPPTPASLDALGRPTDRRRRISIRRFATSRTEITFADWGACVRAGGCDGYQPSRTLQSTRTNVPSDTAPILNVSWGDAQKYVSWLSAMTGREYRLLTEAEWEYAARGVRSAEDPRNGDTWSFGNDASQLRFYANADQLPRPVGTKRPNPFGLYDMHGNVWEWVQDCYGPYDPNQLDGAAAELDFPEQRELFERFSKGTPTCSARVVRGGAGYDTNFGEEPLALDLRSAIRGSEEPARRADNVGFRIARSL